MNDNLTVQCSGTQLSQCWSKAVCTTSEHKISQKTLVTPDSMKAASKKRIWNTAWITRSLHVLHYELIQGHSGGIPIRPEMMDVHTYSVQLEGGTSSTREFGQRILNLFGQSGLIPWNEKRKTKLKRQSSLHL